MKVAIYEDTSKKKFLCDGELLTWGIDHDFHLGGTYTVGIIKLDDGTIKMMYPECLIVLDNQETDLQGSPDIESFQLDEKQQTVLESMKDIQKRWPQFHPSSVIDTLMELDSEYFGDLSKIEELQVFKAFMIWALERENRVN